MATPTTNTSLPAEFQQLPLHAIIAEPLMAVVDAQGKAALGTKAFIQSFLLPANSNVPAGANAPVSNAMTVDFNTSVVNAQNPATTTSVSVSAPLLSIVPIPNLNIDSLSISFKYEVSQVITSSSENADTLGGSLNAKVGFAAWGANLSLSGSVTSDSKQSSTTNRNGSIDIEVHASQAPMPEGLAKILSILASAVTVTPAGANNNNSSNTTQPVQNAGNATGANAGTSSATAPQQGAATGNAGQSATGTGAASAGSSPTGGTGTGSSTGG